MKDLIDRREAIDAINGVLVEDDACKVWFRLALQNLPSAQPEIIRCNSCKHWTQITGEMKGFGLGRCDFHDADLVTCNGFCYWAERRTDG